MAGQFFDGYFAAAGLAAVRCLFLINQGYRQAGAGIAGAALLVVGFKPLVKIVGDAGIESAVSATQDIDLPVFHKSSVNVFWTALYSCANFSSFCE